MWLILLEAGIALFLLVFVVWWTMFSGKPSNSNNPPTDKTPDEHKEH